MYNLISMPFETYAPLMNRRVGKRNWIKLSKDRGSSYISVHRQLVVCALWTESNYSHDFENVVSKHLFFINRTVWPDVFCFELCNSSPFSFSYNVLVDTRKTECSLCPEFILVTMMLWYNYYLCNKNCVAKHARYGYLLLICLSQKLICARLTHLY